MIKEPFSPVCYAAEASDAYMGFADADEILAALNELLEAERAGTRVAQGSRKLTDLPGYSKLMQGVRKDEAHWCAMLTRQIQRLDGSPSRKTGDFLVKAIAIAEPLERLEFLNRGQAWVVRKLEKLMPHVRDAALYADLKDMADNHRINIDLAEAYLNNQPNTRS
jgi:hypothetical protein|tara:strand:+ start:3709 stop:4203 length:495 start_codon:yes stop_codon:yes gene_type:complete